ncbi:MAG: hypothetical protein WBM62_15415 [Crocosphaera sp.]
MENITIQVDSDIAQAYRNANPEQQKNAILMCNLILKEVLKNKSFEDIVQQIRQEAKEKGLTAEVLEQLLKDE